MQKIFLALISIVAFQVTFGQSKVLSAEDFYKKITDKTEKILVDVRTPAEYAGGHVAGAVNIDWTDSGFAKKAALLPRDKPVYVYCLSGGRSAKAADFFVKQDFKNVYEMNGGMMKWRVAKLPEEKPSGKTDALTKADFDKKINSGKLVLVDFYADWCAPCKKMEPYLKEIATEQAAAVDVFRVDADKNTNLARELAVEALPVLHIYKNGKLLWNHQGFIEKEKVVAKLQQLSAPLN